MLRVASLGACPAINRPVLSCASRTTGVTIIYRAPALASSAPPPQSLTGATVLASDPPFAAAAAQADAPFATALSGPVPAGYLPPPALEDYDFTVVAAGTVLPTALSGFVIVPVNANLTAITSTGSPLYGAAIAALQASVGQAPLPTLPPAAAPVQAALLPAVPAASPDLSCAPGSC